MKTFSTEYRQERKARTPCAVCGEAHDKGGWDCGSFSFVRCGKCGLLRQDPQPLGEEVAQRYGASYLTYETENESTYRDLELMALADIGFEVLEDSLARKGSRPRFLDVGCATGSLLAAIRDRGWDVKGVEICRETAEYGEKKYGLEIKIETLEGARFKDGDFDIVHASHLIEHLNDPASFIRQCRKVLDDSGFLILTTPNTDSFQGVLLGKDWRSAIFDHLWLFSKRNLCILLEENGFEALKVTTWGGWARGLKPAFIKPFLDRTAKKTGWGDVMIILARKASG